MYHVQPWMIIGLLPLSVYFEGENDIIIVTYKKFKQTFITIV